MRWISLFFFFISLTTLGHTWTYEMQTVLDFAVKDGHVALALDPTDQRPHIVYQVGNRIYYARRVNGVWESEVVGDGRRPSLSFDSQGRPQIVYQQVADPRGLRLAIYNDTTWDRTTIYPLQVFWHDSMMHPETGQLQVAFIDNTSESVYRARLVNGEWMFDYITKAIINREFTQIEIDPWVGANRAVISWTDNNAVTILPPALHFWAETDAGWVENGSDGDRSLGFSVATDLEHGSIHIGHWTAYDESRPDFDYPAIWVNAPEQGPYFGAIALFDPSEGLPYQDSAIGVHPFNQRSYFVMGDPLAVIRYHAELHAFYPPPVDLPEFRERYDFLERGQGHLRIGGQPSAAFDNKSGLFRFAFIDEVAGGVYYVEEKLDSGVAGWVVYE